MTMPANPASRAFVFARAGERVFMGTAPPYAAPFFFLRSRGTRRRGGHPGRGGRGPGAGGGGGGQMVHPEKGSSPAWAANQRLMNSPTSVEFDTPSQLMSPLLWPNAWSLK